MKHIFIFLYLLPFCLQAQKLPDWGFDKIRIVGPDRVIQAYTKPVTSHPDIKADRFYYWYSGNVIHFTQGGFSGKLLNGMYSEFYLNKNLKEQGNFKMGLKDGQWKTWNEDGTLVQVLVWKNGLIEANRKDSFWHRLNPFTKKKIQSASPTAIK